MPQASSSWFAIRAAAEPRLAADPPFLLGEDLGERLPGSFVQSKAAKTPLPKSWRAMVPRAVPLFGPALTQLPTQPSA
jgi:hypothetical protein